MNFNNLEIRRKNKGLSVQQLSEKSGISAEEIHSLEGTNRFPDDVRTEEALAQALEVKRQEIFVRKDTDY